MIDLPLDDDGFLLMDAFSDDEIDEPEITSGVLYTDPPPISESVWARALSTAVSSEPEPVEHDDPTADPEVDPAGEDDWDLEVWLDQPAADDPLDGPVDGPVEIGGEADDTV